MANNLAGSSQALDSSLNTIYTEFRMLRDETGVARKCATPMPLMPHTGSSKNVLNYGRQVAYNLTDGVDMAQGQSLADTNTQYTPSEVGVQMILPKSTLRRVADPDLLRRTGRMMNNAYDLKEDADGCAQFPSFTPILGSAGTVVGLGHLLASDSILRIGNSRANPEPAPEPHHGILHPLMLGVVAAKLVPLSTTGAGTTDTAAGTYGGVITPGTNSMTEDVLRRGPRAAGTLFNTDWYGDANIAVDANDDASGAVFSQEAFIYISEVEPVMEPEQDDKSLRALELNLWGSYTWGLYRADNYGCEMLFDCTMPTS